MKYLLCRPNARTGPEVEINQCEYEAYKIAKEALENCLSIEEKYDILLSNYSDLNCQVFNLMNSYLVRGYTGYSTSFDIRLTLNRCYVNLLSSARSYTDQVGRHVRMCLPRNSESENIVEGFLSDEINSKLEYRVMRLLRNHVQHFGMPIHWTSLNNEVRERGDTSMIESSLQFSIFKSQLKLDPVFPKKVLNEIPEHMDLKRTTNRYMESLRCVHRKVRELISGSVEESRSLIKKPLQGFSKKLDNDVRYLEATEFDDDMQKTEFVSLMLDWDDQRKELQAKNQSYVNLERVFVTNRSSEKP